VKVFRKTEDPSKQVLKDLDDDFFAQGADHASRGHCIAFSLIQRIRGKQPNLYDLLTVLSTRTTSWARDRVAIAGLLSRVESFKYNDSQAEATRKIIKSYEEVPKEFLAHGHCTLSDTGGFSWCPSSLFYSKVAMGGGRDHSDVVHVDRDGAASALWSYRLLSVEDPKRLQPQSFNLSVEMRIKYALQNWDRCILLHQDYHRRGFEPCILVMVMDVGTTEGHDLFQSFSPSCRRLPIHQLRL
jgi:hypothetical protein